MHIGPTGFLEAGASEVVFGTDGRKSKRHPSPTIPKRDLHPYFRSTSRVYMYTRSSLLWLRCLL